jgi:ABC-2 type transport system permease protein
MPRRLIALMRKELIQFLRDIPLVVLIFLMFLEIALCGWALTLDVRNMPTAVYDADDSAQSRALIESVDRLESFTLVARVADPADLDELLARGSVQLAVVIPTDFSRQLVADRTAEVQLLFDGSNSALASQAMADAYSLFRDYNAKLTMERVGRSGHAGHSSVPQVRNVVRVWYNPELNFTYFVMVTMLTISVLVLGMLLPAASIVREKEAGTFEQLMATPITSAELIAAKTLPMMLFKMVGLSVGVAMSVWLFHVPLRGSLLLFYAVSALMFVGSMGIGVLIGTAARNMQQTLMMSFFLFFPMSFLSGTMVPISNMPTLLQWLTALSPLRYYAEATLGIFLKGVGLDIVWPQMLALTVFGLVLLSISLLRFRKSLA